ncbi:MAG: hypothetical protein PHZ07_04670 [Patescibacteria group bacterium]|nr:hypothetical protein [Patescibacteria group bacterium]MDD4304571.1 hypothetical protein [Patescibacteria group bacterium]MDD4695606.1 hypothetical protein [Patescibacteria group bacterium]
MKYASVKPIIKLKKSLNTLDYIIPDNINASIGQLIEIPFRNKFIFGVIFDIKKDTDQPKNILKSINKIVINDPIITKQQIDFYNFFVKNNFDSLNFVNNIIPLPLKRISKINETKIIVTKTDCKIKNINSLIIKDEKVIFKHNFFEEEISLIKKVIDKNSAKDKKQTLVICPTKSNLKKIYSCLLNFYKSSDISIITGYTHLSKAEHNKIWSDIKNKKTKIIIGTKISIFYPLNNVKTIIVSDAENENHNQTDINPRFGLLENVLELAKINNSQIIFTSYCPPLYLYKLAKEKTIKLFESRSEIKTKIKILEMNMKYFENQIHFDTENYINKSISENKKILFLINKKGYSKSLYCPDCNNIFKCSECDSVLTYIKETNNLYCYNCKKEIIIPTKCPKCDNVNLRAKGIGSKQFYLNISKMFPNKKVLIVDKDHEQNIKLIKQNQIIIATKLIMNYIKDNEFDIIILPFAQQFLNNNFDSNEKFFQFIKKLISHKPEKLILQVLNNLEIYDNIKNQDYLKMSGEELNFRKLFHYPPIYEIIRITIKDKNEKILEEKTKILYEKIKNNLSEDLELLDIIDPKIKKTFSYFVKYIIIKYKPNSDIDKIQNILYDIDIIDKNYFKI